MMRKFIATVATIAFAMATFTATPASAQHWRDRDRGDYAGCRNDNNYGCERDRDRREARNGYRREYGYDRGYYNRPECYDRQGRNHCYDRHDDNDDAVAAGVIGLVLGAVIASAVTNSNNNRQDDSYYRGSDGYDDGYSEPQCTQQVRRWDRTQDRYVLVEVPC
ncbi:hypothetical protein ATE48_08330 [Candidatus Viadribacter manganicus]|uniref:Glycine zipper domain-containing protein n=2 Tax=Candidatus Viadribacter manganicus TaxID=1759059 RepID=A0A1B1AH98_9PROT|nr:hypothetical protein ATE48_08330 [Candidatus Viadribacter manganicus]